MPAMPSIVRLSLSLAALVATAETSIVLFLRRAAAAARVTVTASVPKRRMDRIVKEAQELLVPIGGGAPTSVSGLHRPPLVLVTDRPGVPTTGRVGHEAPQPVSLPPTPSMDPERGRS